MHSGYSTDYPFLTFANDHGLMKNCEAFGGGDGGVYPGGSPNTPGRHSMEIANCKSYHNVLGYSGTQGNHVWVHDTEFFDNAVGLVTDSETDHPNYPQNHLIFERNKVHNNNFNPDLTTSDVKATVFAGFAYIPVGTGLLIMSGNENTVQNNDIWNHRSRGVWLASGYAMVIGPTGPVTSGEPAAAPFMSSKKRMLGNRFADNGVDIAWDGLGTGNCFEENTRPAGAEATHDGVFLPPCTIPEYGQPMPVTAGVPNPLNSSIKRDW